jgi:hypothetical protein
MPLTISGIPGASEAGASLFASSRNQAKRPPSRPDGRFCFGGERSSPAAYACPRAVAASLSRASAAPADRLADLAAKSLIVADVSDAEPRFRLLDTTHAYAIEKLDESGDRQWIAVAMPRIIAISSSALKV